MSKTIDVIVVGGGIGALCASIILASRGLQVRLIESADQLGGKAQEIEIDGVRADTGPSVLTLPHVFEKVFATAGLKFDEEVELFQPGPAFRYIFPQGPTLDVFHSLPDTLESVRDTLGAKAASELQRYLKRSQRIWESAEPHFVFSEAPSLKGLLFGGYPAWRSVLRIEAMSKMGSVIDREVSDAHLRMLLKRYATYNGSDVRSAPATLGCIAHVELALGGHGVVGGMYQLVVGLMRAMERTGVQVQTSTAVSRLLISKAAIEGVELESGELLYASQVIFGGEPTALVGKSLNSNAESSPLGPLSMSAYNALFKATIQNAPRVAHTVIFPSDYELEFSSIFDGNQVPREPTIYVCDQAVCHRRVGWAAHSPLFTMINSPAVGTRFAGLPAPSLMLQLQETLVEHQLISLGDPCLWQRTPQDLSHRFPSSQGALYGLASNDMRAAFRRPSNRTRVKGLYLAGGSAHPGGGVPMVAQSGQLAAWAALRDRGMSPQEGVS